MRDLLITGAVFLLLCAIIVFNFIYINSTEEKLDHLAHSLRYDKPQECKQTLAELERIWSKSSFWFSLSVSSRDTDRINELLLSLSSFIENENEKEFERYRLLLIDGIKTICRHEKLTVENFISADFIRSDILL